MSAGSDERGESLERGRDLSRLAAFSDGVFAIAITLLVLQIEVPSGFESSAALWNGLVDESGDFFAFGLSFAVIGVFWIDHHRFLRSLDAFDLGLMWLNLVFLAFMVLIPFFSQLIGEHGDVPLAVVLYAANLAVLALAHVMLLSHALRRGLVKQAFRADAARARLSQLYSAAVFALTAPLAFLIGSFTPLLWLALAFDPFQDRRKP